VFDPLVSFGASEGLVNDNEQGIVTAARRIVGGLDCCVRVIHHTGKGNAREKTLDQYSGRGGSAMADGSRMTTVLQSWKEGEEGSLMPPNELFIEDNTSVIVMARPKLSYSPPNLPHIWIARTGWMFDFALETKVDVERQISGNADRLLDFLANELKENNYHSMRSLKNSTRTLRMSRSEIEEAMTKLTVSGRVVETEIPRDFRKGRLQTYMCPAYLLNTSN
jgi:RecA-family ATPase